MAKKVQEYKVLVVGTKKVWASNPEEAEKLAQGGVNLYTPIHAEPVSLWGKCYPDNTYGQFKKMARWVIEYVVSTSRQRADRKKTKANFKSWPEKAEGCVVRPFEFPDND